MLVFELKIRVFVFCWLWYGIICWLMIKFDLFFLGDEFYFGVSRLYFVCYLLVLKFVGDCREFELGF